MTKWNCNRIGYIWCRGQDCNNGPGQNKYTTCWNLNDKKIIYPWHNFRLDQNIGQPTEWGLKKRTCWNRWEKFNIHTLIVYSFSNVCKIFLDSVQRVSLNQTWIHRYALFPFYLRLPTLSFLTSIYITPMVVEWLKLIWRPNAFMNSCRL